MNETDNIVKEYKIGNTTIEIHDSAYKNKTPEDIQKILKQIEEIGWQIVMEARAEGRDV
jgi:hypothetical protein